MEDLDILIKQLPQIARVTSVPNFNSITQFFLSKSIQEDGTLAIENNYDHKSIAMERNRNTEMLNDIDTVEDTVEKKLNEVMTAVGLGSCKIDMQPESDVIKRTYSEMYV